jgi:hypothetical protein
MAAGRVKDMSLTQVEKERLGDSQMKLQSVANSLSHIDPKKLPGFEEIQECLEDADKSLRRLLRARDPE